MSAEGDNSERSGSGGCSHNSGRSDSNGPGHNSGSRHNSASSKASGRSYPEDVVAIELAGREIILVGTAHISRESVDLVRRVIEEEQPDCVCVELDERRYKALGNKRTWEALDLRDVIRKRQLATLLVNLVLGAYQKQLGGKLGVMPGSELLEATLAAREKDIPIALCDRDIRVTLRRALHSLSFFQKGMLVSVLVASSFQKVDLSEEDLSRLRKQDVLSELMQELGRTLPALKRVLIDERDAYLAQKIRDTPGNRVVAVVGAGHLQGMKGALAAAQPVDLAELEEIPPVSAVWKSIGWSIPVVILGSIAYIGITKGPAAAGDNALFWFLANAIPSALGCALAMAHPGTIAAAFFAAPFTSLTPLIGAGYVASFAQAYLHPPVVREFQTVSEDITSPGAWWRSRLLRVFLVLLLTSLGSLIGTWVGGVEVVSNLF